MLLAGILTYCSLVGCKSNRRLVGFLPTSFCPQDLRTVPNSYRSVTVMPPTLLAFLENYHCHEYSAETICCQANVLACYHRGKFPVHRYCRGVDIGRTPFNLIEACLWVHREKWNVVWTEDETWLPADPKVVMRPYLRHGFKTVLVHDTDEEFLRQWIEVAGRGFYPFAAQIRHPGFACLVNSRRFAIVARSPQQCVIIAEIMRAYNVLGNRIEVYATQSDEIALTDGNRVNNAVHEDDRSCFDFRRSQECRDAIEGRYPISNSETDRICQLSEGIQIFQRQHNDLVHEANQEIYRVQQSWQVLSEAYVDGAVI